MTQNLGSKNLNLFANHAENIFWKSPKKKVKCLERVGRSFRRLGRRETLCESATGIYGCNKNLGFSNNGRGGSGRGNHHPFYLKSVICHVVVFGPKTTFWTSSLVSSASFQLRGFRRNIFDQLADVNLKIFQLTASQECSPNRLTPKDLYMIDSVF